MKKNISIILILTAFIFTGCKKYLDVSPKSSLADKELFSSETGFQQALSGVYSQTAARNLFGDNLSMGFVSALGQNYNLTQAGILLSATTALNFTSAEVTTFRNVIWGSSYQAIGAINHLLMHLGQQAGVVSPTNFKLIRGEALGLRAYLHFELLRLYGPAFVNQPAQKAIPYETAGDAFAQVPSTTTEVVALVLKDLQEAADLLKDSDPVYTGSVQTRRVKINYFAVKALEARVRLFKEDKAGASAAALAVVNSAIFPFVAANTVSVTGASKNRLFTTELIFSLRNRDVRTWSELLYFKFGGNATNRLTRTEAQLVSIYENSSTDIRWRFLFELDQSVKFPSKFWQTASPASALDTNRLDQLIPMIRLSEMYYILAEAAATPAEGAAYLNQVRTARALPLLNTATITAQVLRDEITKEYQKEFYAEGQLFYYYKRLNFTRIPALVNFTTKTVTAQNFILPIPDLELEFNPTYK